MRLLIMGCGFIGSTIAKAADAMDEVDSILLLDSSSEKVNQLVGELSKAEASDGLEAGLRSCDLFIEAASQAAARATLPLALGQGKDCMVMSVGTFVDDDFRLGMFAQAKRTGAHVYIPSGAICGLDGLRSASMSDLDEVELITIKGPDSMAGVPYLLEKGVDVHSFTAATLVFQGTAREAVRAFPRNVNVAATVSLLGVGFDRTNVKIVVDPSTRCNSHELIVRGRFGEMHCQTRNHHSPDNPATSYLAGLSAVSALRRIVANEWTGV
ncbi:MAG: aspartate dehydrogenase [Candidatus Methanomethylophilaceae archaeon]